MRQQTLDSNGDLVRVYVKCRSCGMNANKRHIMLNNKGVLNCSGEFDLLYNKPNKPVRQPVPEVIEHPNAMDAIDIHVEPLKYHFCTGCGMKYFRFHKMMNHRRTFRCGGEWLLSKYDPANKRRLIDDSNLFTANVRRMIRYRKPNGRIPGVVRKSRLKGGPGFRNNWEG